ncbi:MAG: hypothetical protein LH606_01640 [Cytophagaceae bacterium]|nr:hypothetical protein [Cytophagaceae bacterium]
MRVSTSLEFVVEKTNTGYSAYAVKYPVATTGRTFEELKANALEAINLFRFGTVPLLEGQLRFQLDLGEFLGHYDVLNLEALGRRIAIDPTLLAAYVAGTKKPSTRQQERILRGVADLARELSEVHRFV